MKIVIVGAGTAGFITSLILKQYFPQYQIDMIYSTDIGIVGVGEGSTEHWKSFMQFVGISNGDIVSLCDASYKAGIMFENWGVDDYLHVVEGAYLEKYLERPFVYEHLVGENIPAIDMVSKLCQYSRVQLEENIVQAVQESPVSQYHFNTQKLNDFLINLAKQRNIGLIDDTITDVVLTNLNEIDYIVGRENYNYDFYIDCTGFKKILISKLGAKWESHSDILKMNSAIVFPTENNDYPMWTLARAMDSGWMFRIPVWERKGNGYIFDKNFISVEDAKKEIEEYLGHPIKISKHIEFDPGYLPNPWINNCVAIGLSANFIEPLEATSIGTSIQQAYLLANNLHGYNKHTIEKYNNEIQEIMINIRDFVFLHYLGGRSDTDFWKAIQDIPIPESLQKVLDIAQHRVPIDTDISWSNYVLFKSVNYVIILHALGLLNTDAVKLHFNNLPDNVKKFAHNTVVELNNSINTHKTVSHKNALAILRSVLE